MSDQEMDDFMPKTLRETINLELCTVPLKCIAECLEKAILDFQAPERALMAEMLDFLESLANTVFIVPEHPKLINWKNAYTARAAEAVVLIAKAKGE